VTRPVTDVALYDGLFERWMGRNPQGTKPPKASVVTGAKS
jgi:hypothetical protein